MNAEKEERLGHRSHNALETEEGKGATISVLLTFSDPLTLMEMHSPEDAQGCSHFGGYSSASCITRGPSSTARRHCLHKLGLR